MDWRSAGNGRGCWAHDAATACAKAAQINAVSDPLNAIQYSSKQKATPKDGFY